MAILSLNDVTLRLGGQAVLDRLTFDVWDGHIHGLIGPNGVGKSTTANLIMGLSGYTEFEGDLIFDGQSLHNVPLDERARRGISLAWQEPARFEGLLVKQFIGAASKEKSEAKISDVLEKVGLSPERYAERAVDRTLSGGERKRIELASILAMEPRFVLMDEPDSGIDVEALEHIFEALRFFKSSGTTVLMITHSLAVLRQAEHAFLMCCGRVIEKGDTDKIAWYFENHCIPCDHKNRPDPAAMEATDGR